MKNISGYLKEPGFGTFPGRGLVKKYIRLGVKSGEQNCFRRKAPAFLALNGVSSADIGVKHFSPHSAGNDEKFFFAELSFFQNS